MLYSEFLEGTKAVNNEATYAEYKRVEQIYMAADMMTKEDAYRMAQVETEDQYMARMQEAQKKELAWAKENIIAAAAYIRGMSEKRRRLLMGGGYRFRTPCDNLFELKLEHDINGGSVKLYSFWCNGQKIDTSSTGRTLLDSAEFQSYRADWHDKTLAELEELFGYIA